MELRRYCYFYHKQKLQFFDYNLTILGDRRLKLGDKRRQLKYI